MYHNKNDSDFTELDVILMLLRGRLHLRGIARATGVSPSTTMRVLDRLKARNVIDYDEEGKNKVFFIKKTMQARLYVYMAEHYKLTLIITKYPKLSVILKGVNDMAGNRLIILFGSYANCTATPKSDIDIYVEGNVLGERINNISPLISPKYGKFDTNSPLSKEIMKTHAIINGVENFYERIGFFE